VIRRISTKNVSKRDQGVYVFNNTTNTLSVDHGKEEFIATGSAASFILTRLEELAL